MIKLEELFELQNELDNLIVKKSVNEKYNVNIDHNNKKFLSDRLVALFTEVGEFANRTRCFKYWSSKPMDDREEILEEYADILFFWLSIGNTMKFTPAEVEKAYHKKWNKNISRQNEGY